MSAQRKYRADVKLGDLISYVKAECEAHRVQAHITITPRADSDHEAVVEVSIVPLGKVYLQGALVCERGPVPLQAPDRQWGAILHIAARAFMVLDNNPWQWSPERRRMVAGWGDEPDERQ